jgi:hypothetical protein
MTRKSNDGFLGKIVLTGSAAFIIFCLASCGANGVSVSLDPKAPGEGNFKKAIDEYLATHERDGKACIGFEGLPPFEAYTMTNDPNTQYGQYMRFERAGLLHSSGVGGRKTRFDVTEAGRKVFVPEPDDPIRAHACWANYRVDTVVKWFNHPEDNSMAVNWTYKMTDLVDWAKRPEIASAESDIHVRLDQAGKETRGALLKLSNTGWECTVVTNAF